MGTTTKTIVMATVDGPGILDTDAVSEIVKEADLFKNVEEDIGVDEDK